MKDKIEVHLHTNDNCNLKCIHCYNKSGGQYACNLPEVDSLLEIMQYFCTEYDAEIHLEGGEIFLRPELLRRMDSFSAEILQCITITTNGTICTDEPEAVDMLRKIHALRISVEGHDDEQQRMVRGIALDKVIENALFYKERDIPVWLRLTMTCGNCEHLLDETLPYYMNLGLRNFQVYEFQAVGRGKYNRNLLTVQNDTFDSFLEHLETWEKFPEKEDICLKLMFSGARREIVLAHKNQLALNGLDVFDIPAKSGVSIHADGSVYLCPWDDDENHCILKVYQEGLRHMAAALKETNLKHCCSHCSTVRISYQRTAACARGLGREYAEGI